jgi:hypothetical protein
MTRPVLMWTSYMISRQQFTQGVELAINPGGRILHGINELFAENQMFELINRFTAWND